MDNSQSSPFSMSPNPACLYMTPSFTNVLNKARFVISRRQGMTCILGDIGLGKSSLLRLIKDECESRDDIVTVTLPTSEYKSSFAFLKAICRELELPPKRSLDDQSVLFQGFLVEQYTEQKNVVLLVDEAQKLSGDMLELCRSFLNFETYTDKLIQIVLAGQLELRDILQQQKNRALYSRVFLPALLSPLTLDEARRVIEQRCIYFDIENPFPPDTVEYLYLCSNGVPRKLLMACAELHYVMLDQGLRSAPLKLAKTVVSPEETK